MTQRHNHKTKVVGAFVRIPEPLEDGKVRCNGCSKVIAVSKNGRTRTHLTPAGEPCAYQVVYGDGPKLEDIPEVHVPHQSSGATSKPARLPVDRSQASRLDVGSNCEDCGKWLPGERHVCGRCSNARLRERNELRRVVKPRRAPARGTAQSP